MRRWVGEANPAYGLFTLPCAITSHCQLDLVSYLARMNNGVRFQ